MAIPPILWQPSERAIEEAQITQFARQIVRKRRLELNSYPEFYRWTVDNPEEFWSDVWDFCGVIASRRGSSVLVDGDKMPGAHWFPEARLNFAENLMRRGDRGDAFVLWDERGFRRRVSFADLYSDVSRAVQALQALGLRAGDRAAAFIPNIPEAGMLALAALSQGIVWSSCSPDFGVDGVVERFGQIEPKVLFCADGYRYNGQEHDTLERVREIVERLPTLRKAVVVPSLDEHVDVSDVPKAVRLDEWLRRYTAGDIAFAQLPFDHPLWVLYSSGTTGLPKPIVHGQGGILLEHLKALSLHVDAQPGDRLFWFTTTGWMMWNLLLGGLLTDSAIVLYDGNPATPDLGRLWDLAAETRMTCFGTSASFIDACMKAGVEPRTGRDLSGLRMVGSTGSPLSPEGFRWVYGHISEQTWLFSMSGGTDVVTAFVGGVPTLPVYEGELQARSLGASVEAFDEQGEPVIDQVGELVLTAPLPSMPVFFWNDPDGTRYEDSYFSTYPGVWRHGDWIEITSRGTAIIYGRSDSTINRGGIRMGTSEIYRVVLGISAVMDALVVDADGYMPLFVVLGDGTELDDHLRREIADRIRADCSPRHVPNEVHAVPAIPRTLSGKILEVPVKRILLGADPAKVVSRDSLANPQALDWFVEFARGIASDS